MTDVTSDRRARQVMPVLLLALPVALLLGLANGAAPLSTLEALQGLWQFVNGDVSSQAAVIVGQIRLPRILLAAVVGAILACSGAAMQGLFRNPLADPSLIGVTAGASLGASIMIVLGGSALVGYVGLTLVSFGAFIGGLLAVLLVYRLATSVQGTSVATMLLAGIAITALAGSVGSLLEFYADNDMLRRISLWRMGGLDGADYPRLLIGSVVGIALLLALPRFAVALNAMLLGESEARHLGINVARVKRVLIVTVAISVGTAVALAGTIAFVGLIVPHIVRMLTGPDHRRLLPASALAGALLLVVADTFSRLVLAPTELPVGIVTALIGVPFFISLLRRRHQYGML
ncbi:iron ABC transporter permease [Halieaceae bacterium IMCC14734]|uniref:Iron ABC transporter permease n=1 Tax=Candidatus Litorirhabdus singularis TaxID=2518993 RepID=A0ABT3TKY3_9GAMM|nr:iron ABC transporter permease [Candidatus Litorirhabdus singularis]MCX2982987.1 iron ABC transporter permease [Candidatus Litorirhabdus singularis]